jgi:hypothetical protein
MQLSKLRTYLSCVTPFSISEFMHCPIPIRSKGFVLPCAHVCMNNNCATELDWDLERCQESLDLIKKHEEVAWHLTHGVIRTFAPLIRSYSRIISSFRSYSFVLFRPLCHHRRCQHGVSFYASFVQLRSKRLLLKCFFLVKMVSLLL